MIAFSIINTDIKDFMSKLLKENMFDEFSVRKAEVTTIAKFEINGVLNKDFFDNAEAENRIYCTWGEIRSYFFSLIKGSKRPKSMKIIFSYNDALTENFHSNAKALFLNLSYENNNMFFTTGTSQKNFTLDKDMDNMWDDYIKQFFKDQKIVISTHLQ